VGRHQLSEAIKIYDSIRTNVPQSVKKNMEEKKKLALQLKFSHRKYTSSAV
jgi:hypothetical protein